MGMPENTKHVSAIDQISQRINQSRFVSSLDDQQAAERIREKIVSRNRDKAKNLATKLNKSIEDNDIVAFKNIALSLLTLDQDFLVEFANVLDQKSAEVLAKELATSYTGKLLLFDNEEFGIALCKKNPTASKFVLSAVKDVKSTSERQKPSEIPDVIEHIEVSTPNFWGNNKIHL